MADVVEINVITGEVTTRDYGPEDNIPVLTNSQKYSQEMALLNADYQQQLESLTMQYAKTLLADGTNEVDKVAAIRAQHVAVKSQYSTNAAAIAAKYFS